MDAAPITIKLSYKGKSATLTDIPRRISSRDLLAMARSSFPLGDVDGTLFKLLFKGKIIAQDDAAVTTTNASTNANNDDPQPAFPEGITIPNGGAKVILMATSSQRVQTLNSLRSDPTLRGFDDPTPTTSTAAATRPPHNYWGPLHTAQNPTHKFRTLAECPIASFGTRPGSSTPHAFEARRLLERMVLDPGIVAILTSRKLFVNTLGEMDPIDDRVMLKTQHGGGKCLLGYNTNRGLRIDVKLRTEDLRGFRPYEELIGTLIHELSHNWVGEHDVLFWTNYGQMRVEYLWRHGCLMKMMGGGGRGEGGRWTADLAGVLDMILPDGGKSVKGVVSYDETEIMNHICRSVIAELAREMAQHGIPVQVVAPAIVRFGKELMEETRKKKEVDFELGGGHRLGGLTLDSSSEQLQQQQRPLTAREKALEAAERRAREAEEKKKQSRE
mmetsp:Transcript_17650/g.36864  ORF Transcript_17650/g.36864 Transcript_17650/m.36864 type:complete len:443 (-) Transcript_17650:177-1505(-)